MVASFTPRSYRWFWALFWASVCHPDERDRDGLVMFLDDIIQSAEKGELDDAPTPSELHVPIPTTDVLGRIVWRDLPDNFLRVHIDPQLCTRCGTCITSCSEWVITRADDDEVPVVGTGCTGCYACFNKCPEGAISDALTRPGIGQYRRPPESMKELFRWPR
jgi:ferredoxin